jgi:predicted HicB family RNase H-like nuclease
MPAARGQRQRRPTVEVADPEELVRISLRVPARLRAKANAAAAALNISTTVYLEQLLDAAPMPEPVESRLPLAESA